MSKNLIGDRSTKSILKVFGMQQQEKELILFNNDDIHIKVFPFGTENLPSIFYGF